MLWHIRSVAILSFSHVSDHFVSDDWTFFFGLSSSVFFPFFMYVLCFVHFQALKMYYKNWVLFFLVGNEWKLTIGESSPKSESLSIRRSSISVKIGSGSRFFTRILANINYFRWNEINDPVAICIDLILLFSIDLKLKEMQLILQCNQCIEYKNKKNCTVF